MNDYIASTTPPTDVVNKKPSEHDAKEMSVILSGLSEIEFFKVMHYKSTKNIWDKLQNIYEGDDKVKKAKLQTHRTQIESLKTEDE